MITMATTAAFEDLEKAACCLLQIIRDTQELGKDTKVVIAGDMAMHKYLPKYRQNCAAVSSLDIDRTRDCRPRHLANGISAEH